jgi:hypothetical protein
VEGSASLPIQREVLGKGLADQHLHARFHKNANTRRVLVQTITKPLISTIKERQMAMRLHLGSQLFPLLGTQIDARGIVAAPLKDKDASRRGCPHGGDKCRKVDCMLRRIEVLVRDRLHIDVLKDVEVVPPRGNADVDLGL